MKEELEKMEKKLMEKKLTREKKDNIGNDQGEKRNQAGKSKNKRMVSRTVWSKSEVTQSGAELFRSRRELTTKVGNNLGLSWCTVPRSAVVCVVAYFRRTELLPGVQEGSGILMRIRMEHIKDIIDVNL